MTNADVLFDSAAGLVVQVVCPRCDREVVAVHDSPDGPLLRLEYPAADAADMLRMFKRMRQRGRRQPVVYPVARYVRCLEPKVGETVTGWTVDVHCRKHGDLSIARPEVVAAVERFRALGRVVRVLATITDNAIAPALQERSRQQESTG